MSKDQWVRHGAININLRMKPKGAFRTPNVTIISRRTLLRTAGSAIASVAVAPSLLVSRIAEADVVAWKLFTNPSVNFMTSSTSYVASNLPTNPSFTKQYDRHLYLDNMQH
jgi:hypothetical protein